MIIFLFWENAAEVQDLWQNPEDIILLRAAVFFSLSDVDVYNHLHLHTHKHARA